MIIISCALQAQGGRIPCPMDRNVEFFLTPRIDFLFIFGQCGNNCKYNLYLERKVGVTERPRTLNPVKAIAMAVCPIIVHFSTRSLHDVACGFACALRMHRNN